MTATDPGAIGSDLHIPRTAGPASSTSRQPLTCNQRVFITPPARPGLRRRAHLYIFELRGSNRVFLSGGLFRFDAYSAREAGERPVVSKSMKARFGGMGRIV